jgi:cyclomaltodextrinase / maltogenic alpha-amylase / neopullulanase
MNYPFSRAVLGFCGARTLLKGARQSSYPLTPMTAESFARHIDEIHSWYDWQVTYAQLNLLDSHDTARALWLMGEDQSALRLCVLCQMTMPGAPCV